MLNDRNYYMVGLLCGISCMVIWGFLAIYWKSLFPISSFVIFLYRIVLTGATAFIAALKVYGISGLKEPLKDKKTLIKLFLAGLIITINWNTYIYAINSGQTIEASIGYYIEPLVICIFGIFLFKERPTGFKLISIIFAAVGVLIVLVHFMRVPVIALCLALTFAIYTAIKKHLKMRPLIALFYETIFIIPVALVLLIYAEVNGVGAIATGQPHQLLLLSFVGILTATPLALFAVAANRISMITIGIIEYISPSITLLIGIFVFREAFDLIQLIAFVVIWIGLVFFTYGEVKWGS